MRFRRASVQLLGSKLFSRRDVNSRLTIDGAMNRGVFLAKLWALLGPAASRTGGFEYYVHDQETNLAFVAYVGPRGPAYGGDPEHRVALRRVVEAFEDVLEQTQAVDCTIEYQADPEYGGGTWVLGYKDGRSFDLPDRRNRPPSGQIERRVR